MSEVAKPKVSVILPAYKCWRYLNEAVQSILDQEFDDFEIIIVYRLDNNEEEMKWALSHLPSDNRIRLAVQDGTGYSSACNQAYRLSRGQYVCFQDCDDISMPSRLKKEVEVLDSNETVEMVFSGSYHLDDNDFVIGEFSEKESGIIHRAEAFRRLLCEWNFIPNPSVMFKRRHLVNDYLFDKDLKNCGDYDHNVRVAHDYDIYCLSEPLVKIRRGKNLGNLSSIIEDNFRSRETIYFNAFVRYRRSNPSFTLRQFLKTGSDQKAGYSLFEFSRKRYLKSAMLLFLAICYYPFNRSFLKVREKLTR